MTHSLHLERRDDDLDAQELELISQYVCHEMSAAEEQRFERRLADDQEFFDRVMPLLNLWYDTDAWPIEPVELVSVPVAKATQVWTGRMTKTGLWIATAAGIAFMMLQQIGGGTPVQLPMVAHHDAPHTSPTTAPTTVVAENIPTFNSVKHTLDSTIQKAVAMNTDTAGLRMVDEIDQLGLPRMQFTAPAIRVAAARPISPKVPVRILVMVDSPGVSKTQAINDPLHPKGTVTDADDRGWLQSIIDRIKGRPRPKPRAPIHIIGH